MLSIPDTLSFTQIKWAAGLIRCPELPIDYLPKLPCATENPGGQITRAVLSPTMMLPSAQSTLSVFGQIPPLLPLSAEIRET
jgi:hypothetical protein